MQNSVRYACYEFKPALIYTKKGWHTFYNKYITDWDSFESWWDDMIYHYYLIQKC